MVKILCTGVRDVFFIDCFDRFIHCISSHISLKYPANSGACLEVNGVRSGMRQRAALIRTLALNPDILLLDEPFSALDYQTRLEVSDDIGKIIKEQKKTACLEVNGVRSGLERLILTIFLICDTRS